MPGAAVADARAGAPRLDLRIERKGFRGADGTPNPVLRDVAFTAGPGEVLALFGPSGTGKSTTLRIALGLDRDFAGALRRDARRVGVVFQEPRLLPWLSVAENIRLVVTEGVPPPDIPALLAEVGLPGAGGRWPRELSLGMARRVALARALAVAPDLLVLDEPFASLDPALAAALGGVIAARARRQGATVLFATHELGQALAIAGRLLILSGHPATLAADLPVPDRADAEAMEAFRARLLARFPFLGAGGAVAEAEGTLPPVPAPG